MTPTVDAQISGTASCAEHHSYFCPASVREVSGRRSGVRSIVHADLNRAKRITMSWSAYRLAVSGGRCSSLDLKTMASADLTMKGRQFQSHNSSQFHPLRRATLELSFAKSSKAAKSLVI